MATNEKFCTKCGKKFVAVGREVICPACKQAAAEDAKRAAVLRAKRASWAGESVPVRISGRASTVIRAYGRDHSLSFASALDDLLKASTFFQSSGKAWRDVEPYKSRRLKKSSDDGEQKQDVQKEPVKPVKASASKATGKAARTSKK